MLAMGENVHHPRQMGRRTHEPSSAEGQPAGVCGAHNGAGCGSPEVSKQAHHLAQKASCVRCWTGLVMDKPEMERRQNTYA